MKHARPDYDRIQDPAVNDSSLLSEGATPIGREEPVFLLRAQDVTAPTVVDFWASIQPNSDIATLAYQQANAMRKWQKKTFTMMQITRRCNAYHNCRIRYGNKNRMGCKAR